MALFPIGKPKQQRVRVRVRNALRGARVKSDAIPLESARPRGASRPL